MADHAHFKNTPEVDPGAGAGRVKTEARGGDIEPDGVTPTGPTDSPRGKYPQDNGGPPEPHSGTGVGPSGDHLEIEQHNEQIPPVATRRSPDEPTTTNPLA